MTIAAPAAKIVAKRFMNHLPCRWQSPRIARLRQGFADLAVAPWRSLLLLTGSARLRHAAMRFGEHARGRDMRRGCLQLVLPTGDDVALAVDHRVPTVARDL